MKKELFEAAKTDYSAALNLGGLIAYSIEDVKVSELLDSFLILRSWIERLEKEEPDEDARVGRIELLQGIISVYEKMFQDGESHILFYLRTSMSSEAVKNAKAFVEQIQSLPNVPESLKKLSFD